MTRLGGTPTQVGLLFSVMAGVTVFLRPLAGGWIDRHGARITLLPGVGILAATSLLFQFAGSAVAVVALMAGLGLAHALVTTSSGVVAAQAGPAERRGEALSVYYVASSIAMALGAPAGVALYRLGGIRTNFAVVTGISLLAGLLALNLRLPPPAPEIGGRTRPALWSRHALPAAAVLLPANLGGSAVYAFVPLQAISHGLGSALGWFFAVFSVCLVVCRLGFRRTSDRIGRARVLAASITATAAGFLILSRNPTWSSLMAAALFLGAGASLLYPTLAALVVDHAPEQERGLALGTLAGAFDVTVLVGSALLGVVAERASYGAAFAVAGAASTLGLVPLLAAERARFRIERSAGIPPGV